MSRTKGAAGKKTLARVDEFRRRIAAGMSEDQIRDVMGLSQKAWRNLLKVHFQTTTPENNAQYMLRFAIRQAERYRTVSATLPSAQGKRHPRAGQIDPESGEPFPVWAERPNVDKVCRIVKTLSDLDTQSLDVGLKLGIYEEAARKVDVHVGGHVSVGEEDPKELARRVYDLLGAVGYTPMEVIEELEVVEDGQP